MNTLTMQDQQFVHRVLVHLSRLTTKPGVIARTMAFLGRLLQC